MSNNATATSTSSISFMGLLGIIFVCLKLFGLTDVATWSWWLVLMPFWIGLAIFAAIFLVFGILALIVAVWG